MMRNSNMIRLSAPLALASTDSAKLPSQFTGVAYSGGVAPGHGVVIDVSTTQVPASMALLSEHDRTGIVGLVDDAAVSNGQIIVKGKLFSDMPGSQAERIAQQAQRGFPYQMSIGLFDYTEEDVPRGQTRVVNNQLVAGPVTVLRNGKVRECSVVTLGADPQTSAAFFSDPADTSAMETALMAFQARLQARALAQGAPVLKSSAALIQDRQEAAFKVSGGVASAATQKAVGLTTQQIYAMRREPALASGRR